jgi:hypothetical protein
VPTLCTYDYAVVRVVPQVERGEFVNAGVIIACASQGFLKALVELDDTRVRDHDLGGSDVIFRCRWRDDPTKIFSFDQLEHDVWPPVDVAGFEAVHDIRMARQCRGELLLDGKLARCFVVAGEVRVQALERCDRSVATRAPHLAESTHGDECVELPATEASRHVGLYERITVVDPVVVGKYDE